MRTYILRRALQTIPLLLGVTALTFLLMQLAPGDFLSQMAANPEISPGTLAHMRHQFGLDRPWWVQYLLYLRNVFLHLDFGQSFAFHRPVFEVLRPALLNTLVLALAAAVVTWALAIPLGVLAAVHHDRPADRALSFAAFLGLSVPEVLSGLLLLLFAARTRWFPIGGMHDLDYQTFGPLARQLDLLRHLALPALTVGLVPLAGRMRQMRASMLDVLRLEFVTTARAKGLPESAVVGGHALRNALNPMITLFGFTLGSLLSGSLVAEFIFSWPGIGSLTYQALQVEDPYLVMGGVLLASAMLVAGNLAADLLLAIADPRIARG